MEDIVLATPLLYAHLDPAVESVDICSYKYFLMYVKYVHELLGST